LSRRCVEIKMHAIATTSMAVENEVSSSAARTSAPTRPGHKTEAVYRRYAIVSSSDLEDAARKRQRTMDNFGGQW